MNCWRDVDFNGIIYWKLPIQLLLIYLILAHICTFNFDFLIQMYNSNINYRIIDKDIIDNITIKYSLHNLLLK